MSSLRKFTFRLGETAVVTRFLLSGVLSEVHGRLSVERFCPRKKGLSGGSSLELCFPIWTKWAQVRNCSGVNFPWCFSRSWLFYGNYMCVRTVSRSYRNGVRKRQARYACATMLQLRSAARSDSFLQQLESKVVQSAPLQMPEYKLAASQIQRHLSGEAHHEINMCPAELGFDGDAKVCIMATPS